VSRRGWLLFVAMSVIWGIPYLLIKVAVGGVPVPVLVLARVAGGAALLLPIAIRRRELRVLLPRWRWLVLFAFVEIIVPWLLLSEAETRLSSSLSGLLVASVPILVAVGSRLTGGSDRLTPVRWAGLLVGLAGVGLLVGPSASGGDLGSVLEVLLVAVCYATGPLIVSRQLGDLPPLAMTAACLTFASLVYAPLAAVTWPSAWPSAKVLAALAGLAVVCTALAFVLFFALIAEVGPARASVITYVNPAIAVTGGVWLLGERLTPAMALAFAAILGGSVLATRTGGPALLEVGPPAPPEAGQPARPGGGAAPRDGGAAPRDGGAAPRDGGAAPRDGGAAPRDAGAMAPGAAVVAPGAVAGPEPNRAAAPAQPD
jgi:drug/metabolite transporter (DMT)-like permease